MLGLKDTAGKRDKFTLMVQILNSTTEPVKKTHLLYKAGINFHQLDRYLTLLESKGLIKTVQEPVKGYQITDKGVQFLALIRGTKTVTSTDVNTEVDPEINTETDTKWVSETGTGSTVEKLVK